MTQAVVSVNLFNVCCLALVAHASGLEVIHAARILAPGQSLAHTIQSVQKPLRLCDCEVATGSPGLSCARQGFFISGFQHEGQWLAGGGLVPLSRAICCRPCLPNVLPAAPAVIGSNVTALAVVSIGCHKENASGPSKLQCPGPGHLVAGFIEYMQVNSQTAAYYPLGAAECCTPGVLLSNGDAWELEQCDCQMADGVSCGGQATGRLLAGFEKWRMTLDARFVPIAPPKCCSLCLGQKVHKMSTCDIHNGCTGHGVCIAGQCECLDGYSGSDCSQQPSGLSDGLPIWLMILLGTAILALVLMIVWIINRLVRLISADSEAGSEDGSDLEEPLLTALHDEIGSVGSINTDDDIDSETGSHIDEVVRANDAAADAEQRMIDALDSDRMRAVENVVATAQQLHPDDREAGIACALRGLHDIITQTEGGDEDAVRQVMQAVSVPLVDIVLASYRTMAARNALQGAALGRATGGSQNARSEEHIAIDIQEPQPHGGGNGDHDAPQPAHRDRQNKVAMPIAEKLQAMSTGALASLDCSVCLTRSVQVALVPCGHACMCRRCSRRLSRCPICRRNILRRQRLFVGG